MLLRLNIGVNNLNTQITRRIKKAVLFVKSTPGF